jgi:hypothetical protein
VDRWFSTNWHGYDLMLAPPQLCSFFKMAAIDFCRRESISALVGWCRSLSLEWLSFVVEFIWLWRDLHYGGITPVLVTEFHFAISPSTVWRSVESLLGFKRCVLNENILNHRRFQTQENMTWSAPCLEWKLCDISLGECFECTLFQSLSRGGNWWQ